MNKNIIESALARFKNDERFTNMKKEDFLKEVASYVINLKDGAPAKTVQFESTENLDIDSELNEADKLLESSNPSGNTGNAYTDKFNPKGKIVINSLKKKVLDEAYTLSSKKTDNAPSTMFGEDPVKEFIETWG